MIARPKTVFSLEAFNEGFGNFLRHFDFTSQLKKIRCPTLVLGGQQDWICGPQQSKIIAKLIPKAKLKIFKNSSHFISVDVHDQYIKIIKNFLKKK